MSSLREISSRSLDLDRFSRKWVSSLRVSFYCHHHDHHHTTTAPNPRDPGELYLSSFILYYGASFQGALPRLPRTLLPFSLSFYLQTYAHQNLGKNLKVSRRGKPSGHSTHEVFILNCVPAGPSKKGSARGISSLLAPITRQILLP